MSYVDCRTCKSDCPRNDGRYGYTMCKDYTGAKPTNADHIRAMSDEELAVEMCELLECENCPAHKLADQRTEEDKCLRHVTCCEANLLSWLKSEAKEASE